MKRIRYYTEAKIDLYMKQGYFFKRYQFSSETAEKEFYALQDSLRVKLEKMLTSSYGANIFVSDRLWPNESFKVDMSQQILSPQLIADDLSFLQSQAPSHCIVSAVYRDLAVIGSSYFGRILISEKEISVEESLKNIFQKQCLDPLDQK